MAEKFGNGYYNHIVYLNGGNTKDAWKMVVLNGKFENGYNHTELQNSNDIKLIHNFSLLNSKGENFMVQLKTPH